jgi:molybdopterin molybdotransferase
VGNSNTLITAAEARRRLHDAVEPLPSEIVVVDANAARLSGRVLATDVCALHPIPNFDRAAVDGFAVRAVDVQSARPDRPVTLVCEPGETPGVAPAVRDLPSLFAGRAWPIATGARTPPGADAVVMVEHTTRVGDDVTLTAPIAIGRNVIRRGEDVDAGATIARVGRSLAARDLALIGAAGVATVSLRPQPRVAVLSSGAELVALAVGAHPGQVSDVNQPALMAAVEAAGGQASAGGIVSDDPIKVAGRIAELAIDHDIVIVSGGTSVGRADHTRAAIELLGAATLFHGVAMRPGRPTLAGRLTRKSQQFATRELKNVFTTLVIGLPGVPAAALTVFAVFVRPVILHLSGRGEASPLRVRLCTDVASVVGREDYIRVQLDVRDGMTWAKPLSGTSSSLSALATADGVAVIPTEVATLPAGDLVEVIRF